MTDATPGTTTPAPPAPRMPAITPDPLTTVLDVLELEQTGDDTFVGQSLPKPGGRVFGGQVLAQTLLAASRTLDGDDRLPHSVHGYFLRPGDVREPITFSVERLRDGRSFSARRTHAFQRGVPILSMTSSFQVDQPGAEHALPRPLDVPDPEDVPSALDVLAAVDHPVAAFWTQSSAFDLRHVESSIYLEPAPERSEQRVWMRARGPLPDDQVLHRALLAYACDQVMLEPVLRRHGASWATPDLAIASLDHAMWWHRPVRVDEWLLYVQSTPSSQGGRGLGLAEVFTRDGTLVASIAQEGMVRLG